MISIEGKQQTSQRMPAQALSQTWTKTQFEFCQIWQSLQKYEDRLGAAVQERGLLQLHKIIATAQPRYGTINKLIEVNELVQDTARNSQHISM